MNKKIAKLGEKTNLTKEDVKKLTKIGISGLLALLLSVFTVGWSDSNAAELKPQSEKDKAKALSERCRLEPERGPCKAIFDKYYFDAGTNKCKIFTYGGCDGVVPFETQEACDTACIGQQTYGFPVGETRRTGTLHRIVPQYTGRTEDSFLPGEKGHWLTLDSPIVFDEGSKSERVVKSIRLTVPADLREKALKLEGHHVVVAGPMDCTMHYSPWTASCEMIVKLIDMAE